VLENERAQLAVRVEERTAELRASNDTLGKLLRGKSTFLATMSHEIRTPINGLMGTLELLALTDLAVEQQEMLQGSRDAGAGLLRIIDDILDYSKMEAGKMSLVPAPTSIAGLVARTVGTYRSVAGIKGLSLTSRVDRNISPSLMVDAVRLSQILNNFVSNALKFTVTGTVAIEAALVERFDGAEKLRVTVTDSGIGIDKSTHTRLFGAYEQGPLDTGRVYGGTGLGLSICKRLTEMMGGDLALESDPGKGSRFSLSLTLAVVETPVSSPRGGTAGAAPSLPQVAKLDLVDRACRVLCADDVEMNRTLIERQLAVLGVNAEVADSGEGALQAWREGHFSLLITDCHMPGLDGYGLARAIRAEEASSGRPRMPILAWTANAFESEIGRCIEAGMDACLSKPCALQSLRDGLSPWLERVSEHA
jgi:two-component system sensor histidine kinase EvgS